MRKQRSLPFPDSIGHIGESPIYAGSWMSVPLILYYEQGFIMQGHNTSILSPCVIYAEKCKSYRDNANVVINML